MYSHNSNSVIKRSRAERKKLGITRIVPPPSSGPHLLRPMSPSLSPKAAEASTPVVKSEPVSEPDIVDEILQESPKVKPLITEKTSTDCPSGSVDVKGEPEKKITKKKSTKKKETKKSDKKRMTSQGKNIKVAELDQEELSDLFSGPTATVDDDDDE